MTVYSIESQTLPTFTILFLLTITFARQTYLTALTI